CLPGPWEALRGAVAAVLDRLRTLYEENDQLRLHAELNQMHATAEARCGHLGRGAGKVACKVGERRVRHYFAGLASRAAECDRRQSCRIVQDVRGNPFDPVTIRPAWVQANGGRVRQLAGVIEEEGCYDEMAVLADALQDAGCTEPRLLDHCLEDHHYRG